MIFLYFPVQTWIYRGFLDLATFDSRMFAMNLRDLAMWPVSPIEQDEAHEPEGSHVC